MCLLLGPLAVVEGSGLGQYNKYLEWELARHPLPGWDTDVLLRAVDRISATGDVLLQRHLFPFVETAVREAGHGEVLHAWGEDLDPIRPQ